MQRLLVPSKAWIVVCDGSKSLLWQNIGDAQAINLKAIEVANESHPPTRESGTERPGRVYDAMDGSRSSVDSPDWHDVAEVRFLRTLARHLDELVRTRGIRHLIVAAPPRALGVLRDHFTAPVRAVLAAEIPKDLVKLPTPEIERYLAAMGELP